MNGLPGLVGSGMPETFEMLRVLKFLNQSLTTYQRPISIPTEFSSFMHSLKDILHDFFNEFPCGESSKDLENTSEFDFWDKSNNARERYRASVLGNLVGTFEEWPAAAVLPLLQQMIVKTNAGIKRALGMTPRGETPTYFYYEADDFYTEPNSKNPLAPPLVFPRSFKVHTVPLFLEGPTRHLKVIDDTHMKQAVYKKVKSSGLYDEELGMYKISADLKSCVPNIGRMMAFAAGWLENESVWLHMSYKFYLELLRGGLYQEFFDEIKTGLVPFMDPLKYGRSPVEASSFIVPSVFPDSTLHGTGFLARLSGSTAEFLSMWALMMAGNEPFFIDRNGITNLQFRPILPGWLFTNDTNEVSFTFLGHTLVTYHNPDRKDTWGNVPISATLVADNGNITLVDAALFTSDEIVNMVRNQRVEKIDVYF